MSEFRRGFMVLTLVLGMAGCSVFNPRVGTDLPRPGPIVTIEGEKTKRSALDFYHDENVTLDEAIAYAHAKIDRYEAAREEHDVATTALGAALFPLGAAALGLGVWEGNPRLITGLALGGATAYGAGTYLIQPTRAAMYHEGITAMNCAITAIRPLDRNIVEFKANLKTLRKAIVALGKSITYIDGLLNNIEAGNATAKKKIIERAVRMRGEADRIQMAAIQNYESGSILRAAMDGAGNRLADAVDRIAEELNDVLGGTIPSLDAAWAAVGGLRGTATRLLGADLPGQRTKSDDEKNEARVDRLGAKADEDPTKKADVNNELTSATNTLANRIAETSMAAALVAGEINAVTKDQPAEDIVAGLKECKISEDVVAGPVTLDPPSPVKIKPGESKAITIKGGIRPFNASLDGPAVGEVSVEPTFGRSFVVRTTEKTSEIKSFLVRVTSGKQGQGPVYLEFEVVE